MNAVQIYLAVAAATLTMGAWAAVAYHLHRNSTPYRERWYYLLWMVIPPAITLGYFSQVDMKSNVTTGAGIFASSVMGMMFGGMALFILKAICTNDHDNAKQRRHQIIALVVLSAVFFGVTFGI